MNVQQVLFYFFENFQNAKFLSSQYLWILSFVLSPFEGNMIVLVIIMPFYHQKLLRCISNTLRSPKFPKFGGIFQPARLFHPTRLFDTLE